MFEFSSIEQYHAQLKEGSISCREAVQYFIDRITDHARLNAFVEVYAYEALRKAAALDEARRSGKPMRQLHGVVIALKDVIAYKDHRLTASSKILDNFTSLYSATAVERLLEEEAIIIGNCNCDEFAMGSSNENSFYGRVLNALDETKVPGGSSGGSAVAVQAGLCMLALGSDTGGSVRQPADFCGIIGLKPGYGRISRYGLIAYASSFDQIGIFGRSIPDVAKLLEVMAGPDAFDSTVSHEAVEGFSEGLKVRNEKKYRFAFFPETLNHSSLDKEIAEKINATIEELLQDGHVVEAVKFDYLDYLVPAYYVLTTAEASSNLSRYDGVRYGYRTGNKIADLTDLYKKTRTEGFGKEVKRRIMLGSFVLSAGYYDAYFTKAQQVRQLLVKNMNEVFRNYDFLLMPASPVTAFDVGEKMKDPVSMYLADIFTVMANLTGCPAISLPLYRHSNGLPFGLQVMANRLDELSLLQVSNGLMQ